MTTQIIDFDARDGSIDGLVIVTVKQITDERGTIRELYRRSAFESIGVPIGQFRQINVTETRRGAVRGMHAEYMTKLVNVTIGEAFGAFVDLRHESPTFGAVDSVSLLPGVQVLVPAGVANGFQTVSDVSQYVYCFDDEWRPGMPGSSITPLDRELAIPWPLPIDPDDPAQISDKDRNAPSLAEVAEAAR